MGPTHFNAALLLVMSAVPLLRECRATLWEDVGLTLWEDVGLSPRDRDAELAGKLTAKLSLPSGAWIPLYGTRCTGVCGTD